MTKWPIESSTKLPPQGKHLEKWEFYLRIVVNVPIK